MEQGNNSQPDVEKATKASGVNVNNGRPTATLARQQTNTLPFIGRLGGNQEFALDSQDVRNASILKSIPDAAPYMSFQSQFALDGFWYLSLWKSALVEGMGTMMLTFLTIWISISPSTIPVPPTAQLGFFDNAAFFGPLIGGVTNWLLITLFTYTFGALTGAHFNPAITIATFFARLCSFPRMILYVSFQTSFASLSGLLVRASFGSRDFKVGGCFLFTDHVPVSNAWVIEFMCTLTLLFLAFGVGLDPRQKTVIGPALGPFLVGMTLGVISFGSAYSRYGYGGAGMNPARCFGAFVGSRFPGWHWIHWTADIAACIVHGLFYGLIPPWQELK